MMLINELFLTIGTRIELGETLSKKPKQLYQLKFMA